MSTLSPQSTKPSTSSPIHKQLAWLSATVVAGLLLLALPDTQHALALVAHPAHTAVRLLHPGTGLPTTPTDFWHTRGNLILDSKDRPVRISGVNWSGFETTSAIPGGLDRQDYRAILRSIKQNGFNTVRIPFSNEMVEMPIVPEHVSFANSAGPINADLHDLTSIEIMDRIIAYSGKIGLKVILDNHRSEAGSSAQDSGLWYTPQFPEANWIADWTALAHRYQNTSTVIGMDLRNEPHNADKGGSCWDCGGPNDWHRAAQRAGNAILGSNPHLLIFVEGVDSYNGDTYWWGGNLEGVRRSPVRLSIPNRLVYSAHEYGPAEYAQPWFNPGTGPTSLASLWRRHWAYISEAGIAPVWIGEFGTANDDTDIQSSLPGSEGQWFGEFVSFLSAHPALGWTYWGVNGEDRYGFLDSTYSGQPANPRKLAALATIVSEPAAHIAQAVAPPPPVLDTYPPVPTTFHPPVLSTQSPLAPAERLGGESVQIQMPDLRTVTTGGPGNHIIRVRSVKDTPDASVQGAIRDSVRTAVTAANGSLGGKVSPSDR